MPKFQDLPSAEYDGQTFEIGSMVISRPGSEVGGVKEPTPILRIVADSHYSGGYKLSVKPGNRMLAFWVSIATVQITRRRS